MRYEPNEDFLVHYGVKGMKWGHRKNVYDVNANYYNNRASKLERKASRNRTMAGMNARAAGQGRGLISKANNINAKYYTNKANKLQIKADKNRTMARMNETASKQKNAYKQSDEYKARQAKRAKAIKTGAAIAGAALAAYGGYKLNKYIRGESNEIRIRRGMAEIEGRINGKINFAKNRYFAANPNAIKVDEHTFKDWQSKAQKIRDDGRKELLNNLPKEKFKDAAERVYYDRKDRFKAKRDERRDQRRRNLGL